MKTSLVTIVVDDDELDRRSVRRLGEKLGWQVEEASSLAGLLARLADPSRVPCDCVLLDFKLPDGDGFEALAALGPGVLDAPVVILTGLEEVDVAVRLLSAGAADYLPKRLLTMERLGTVVDRVTRASRAERDRQLAEARLVSHQRLLSAVVGQLPSGLIITDSHDRILLRNAKLLEIVGQDVANVETLTELVAQMEALTPGAPRVELARAFLVKTEDDAEFKLPGFRGEMTVRLRRLEVYDDTSTAGVAGAAGVMARIAVVDDVTDLLATEAYQRQVMAIASHDLRNPLSAISMNAAILSRAETMTDERRVKTASRIASSAKRMGRMIEDLFDYTLVALGNGIPLRPRSVDLASLIDDAVGEFRALHPSRDIQLRKEGSLVGTWDPDRLHQVLQNLLSNAIQYGAPETSILVVCVEDPATDAVDISVENGGATIPPDLLPHVFEAYRSGTSSGRRGLGLGLFISRRIVEAHQGDITVASTEETTRFSVRLPKVRSEQGDQRAVITPPQGRAPVPSKP